MNNNLRVMFMMSIIFSCSSSLTAMDLSIEGLRAAYVTEKMIHRKSCPFCQHALLCSDESEIDAKFWRQRTELILSAGDQVSDQEKLDNAFGEKYFPQRKEIIKKMINEGAHPNNIVYLWKTTPMSDAVFHKDKEFISFLCQHGASLEQ